MALHDGRATFDDLVVYVRCEYMHAWPAQPLMHASRHLTDGQISKSRGASFSGVVKHLPAEHVKEASPVPDWDLSPAEVPEVHLYPWHEPGWAPQYSPLPTTT